MGTSFHILTDDELAELTGYATATKQKEVLRRNGIHFIEGKGGKIRTTSENLRYPLATVRHLSGGDDGFNIEAI